MYLEVEGHLELLLEDVWGHVLALEGLQAHGSGGVAVVSARRCGELAQGRHLLVGRELVRHLGRWEGGGAGGGR